MVGNLTVRRLGGSLGAEITGVRLAGDMAESQVTQLRRALLANKVIFVRDQGHLDDDGHLAFAKLLGPLAGANPLVNEAPDKQKRLVELRAGPSVDRATSFSSYSAVWHTDVSFIDRPPSISILRALTIPSFGGDTLWANTVQAYAAMSSAFKTLVRTLVACHTSNYKTPEDPDPPFQTNHPVVRVHPETGEPSILLGMYAKYLVGFEREESQAIMRAIQRHIERPENTVRWNWRTGDVAIWDNRATQHYALSDYTEARLMRRATLAGDVPVGLDGRKSEIIKGDASHFSPIHCPPRLSAVRPMVNPVY